MSRDGKTLCGWVVGLACVLGVAGCGGSGGSASPPIVALLPVLSYSPASLTFGTTTTGIPSSAQTVTVTNSGTGPLVISAVAASGDFAQTNNGCTTLAVNATCTVSVVFTPTAVGTRTGTLTLTSNSAGSPQTVALTGTGAAPIVYTGVSLQATVLAGTKAISGASVQFYATGTTGNGSAATALLTTAVMTNASGVATIPAQYNCPAAGSLVYLVSRGGTVAGTLGSNPNIVMMAAIGTCASVVSGQKFVVDEATTVAAAYALAPFYTPGGTGGGQVGTTATNALGLANAFQSAASLADVAAGTSPGASLPGNAGSPAARVNSVANLLNVCVVSSAACAALYTSTTSGSVTPANTLDAAWNLARNPGTSIASLYTQSLLSTAYAPALAAAPSDWTMFLTLSGGGMNEPSGIAVDSTGSVWVADYFNAASKFTTAGVPVFANGVTGSGLNNSYGLAIDLNDNVWIPNEQAISGLGSVTELTSAGAALSGANGYLNGGYDYPLYDAIDPNGTVWVLDYGNSHLTLLNSTGTPLSGPTGYTTSLFAFPVAIAIDSNHFGWVVNQASNFVTKVAPDGSSFTNYSCCNQASGIAIDQGDNLWVADYFGDTVSLMTNSGTVISSTLTGNGSIYHPQGIAVDGAGTVWVANYRKPYLTELAGATTASPGAGLSPATGLGADAKLLEAYAMALDASGNIWVTNQGSNTITKFIGLATPVRTPLSGLPKVP